MKYFKSYKLLKVYLMQTLIAFFNIINTHKILYLQQKFLIYKLLYIVNKNIRIR